LFNSNFTAIAPGGEAESPQARERRAWGGASAGESGRGLLAQHPPVAPRKNDCAFVHFVSYAFGIKQKSPNEYPGLRFKDFNAISFFCFRTGEGETGKG
jgi:hypothetical protein